jgi:putative membrane protein
MKHSIVTYLKGAAMGSADVVPGVSGGTIAFITGIYTRLIDGITHALSPQAFINDTVNHVKSIDWELFLPLGLGIATALLALSHVIQYLLSTYPSHLYAFFFGLILASAVYIYRAIDDDIADTISHVAWGTLTGIVIVGVEVANPSQSLTTLFVSGMLAITAMILPGISGAFILLMLDQYEHVIGLIATFDIIPLTVFTAGAITGIAAFAHLLHWLLHERRTATLGFLTGLMLGSLKLPYEQITVVNWHVVLIGAVGMAVVLGLHAFAEDT